VLLRLAYLGVTNVFALLRLLPRSDHDKHAEILVLRHQLSVLQRQLGEQRMKAVRNARRSVPPVLQTHADRHAAMILWSMLVTMTRLVRQCEFSVNSKAA
jgi:hypothetical protein